MHSSHYSEWRSGNVFIAPFDKDDVFALLVNDVADRIALVSLMFDHNFITRYFRAINADVENVVACTIAVHAEAVLTADQGFFQTFAPRLNLDKNSISENHSLKTTEIKSYLFGIRLLFRLLDRLLRQHLIPCSSS